MPETVARPWPSHSPERHAFSVLCWRGYCDYDFKCRDVAATITEMTGIAWPVPANLPARECPTPDTCQCECHDEKPEGT